MRSIFLSSIIICLVISSVLSHTMEEAEEGGQELTDTEKIISAITLYRYNKEEAIVVETIEEDYQYPYTYSMQTTKFNGFVLPENYQGDVNITESEKTKYVGLLYCLMQDNTQLLSVIHANKQHDFITAFDYIFRDKLEAKKKSIVNVLFQCTESKEVESSTNIEKTVSKAMKDLPNLVIGNLDLCRGREFTITLNPDPKESHYSSGLMAPVYFLRPNAPHYLDIKANKSFTLWPTPTRCIVS